MTKILFHTPNLIDVATLTASTEDPDFPVENLQNEQRSITYRSTDDDDENITADLSTAKEFNSAIIIDHNISSGATIKAQANSSNASFGAAGSPPVNQAMMWNAGPIITRFSPAETYRWFNLSIDDDSNPDGFIEIGRVMLCKSLTPNINFSWRYRKRRVDLSETVVGAGAQVFTNLKQKIREYEFAFRCRRADVQLLEAFFEEVGIGKPLAISFHHDSYPNTELKYGHIMNTLEYSHDAFDAFTVSTIIFREAT